MPYLTDLDDIREAIARYSQVKTLWLDIEVANYQSKDKAKVSLIQVLDDSTDLSGDQVTVLDVLQQPKLVDEFVEQIMIKPDLEKVIHYATYDLQYLGGKRKAKNVTCTWELAKSIPYYIIPLPNYQLKTLAESLCYFPPIDKSEQGGDWGKRPLSEKQLAYAKMDAVYVAQVHHRLLQLSQLTNPNPETENIDALVTRYQQIEPKWKELDTEIYHIKSRIKKAMIQRKINNVNGFQLSSQNRTTKTIKINELVKVLSSSEETFDLSLKVTSDWSKALGKIFEELPIDEVKETIMILREKEIDEDEDLPF
ncbi:ribonuclease D [Aphanothece hegewaldii CCALA 016]|uniref:Ribonuclease D n=1 Tax=Aphanothece hegewaldii CCALA 016 TaxID=2107694 RepID=A0A2T1LUX6_9CHRO|nr:ribonuclease D [Aphanothece hegewaldii]PSF35423.1 ribonuclease D [Aphanothece hegewaldii CCALA 016]